MDNPPLNVKLLKDLEIPKSAHIDEFKNSLSNKYNFMKEYKHLDKSIMHFESSRRVKRRDSLVKSHIIFECEPNLPGRIDAADNLPYMFHSQPYLRPIDKMP